MYTKYFDSCYSLEDVKRRYKTLCKRHHPDVGDEPDTLIMSEINSQYSEQIDKYESKRAKEDMDIEMEDVINDSADFVVTKIKSKVKSKIKLSAEDKNLVADSFGNIGNVLFRNLTHTFLSKISK